MVDERGFGNSCHVLVRSEWGGADSTLTRNASTHSIFQIERSTSAEGLRQVIIRIHPGRSTAGCRRGDDEGIARRRAVVMLATSGSGARASFAGRVRSHEGSDAGRNGQGIPLAEPAHVDRGPRPRREGQDVLWGVELTSPTYLVRAGWKSNTIKPGDKVTVVVNPVRSGEPAGIFRC